MAGTPHLYHCRGCQKELAADERPCSRCGATNRRVEVVLEDTIKFRDSISVRQKRQGFRKFMKEIVQGWFPNIVTKNSEHGVDKVRIIDKEKNEYHETVKDLRTGKIIHDVHESLTKHNKNNYEKN